MKHIEVVAAIIQHEDKTLCVQRGPAKYEYIEFKFEFPGGKVEPHETNKEALIRELKEELRIEVRQLSHYMTIEHSYPDFKITLHAYICPVQDKQITLTEHICAQWLSIDALDKLDWAAADIPIIKQLQHKYSS